MFWSFYASPVDQRNLDAWRDLGERLRQETERGLQRAALLDVRAEPRLAPGHDLVESRAELEELALSPREIRIELWSAHATYGVVALILGRGMLRAERRALHRRWTRVLAPHRRLRETQGVFDLDAVAAIGYALDPADAADQVEIRWLMETLDQPVYLGERWLLQDRSEAIDAGAYTIDRELGPSRLIFQPENDDAELAVWAQASSGEGLLALDPEDPALPLLARSFATEEGRESDLATLLTRVTDRNFPRITLGRGPGCPGGPTVMLFDPPGHAPEIETQPVFFL